MTALNLRPWIHRLTRAGARPDSGLRAFCRSTSGAVAIYVAFISTALVGALVLAVDIGRLTIVRTQMQNAADAAASAAAVQLDGQSGAQDRATTVAQTAAQQISKIQTTDGVTAITVQGVSFFSQFTPTPIAAIGDSDSDFVQVTMTPRNVSLLLQPALAALLGEASQEFTQISASAVATAAAQIICDPPPLLVCNANEIGATDVTTSAAAGLQILLRNDGISDIAPGNFGLMCRPSQGNCNAGDVEQNLAAEGIDECTATTPLVTKPGKTSGPSNNGFNSRFDQGSLVNAALNIIAYPRDSSFQSNYLGDGVWEPVAYWNAAHDHNGNGTPDELFPFADLTSATRYQVYLYELGEPYARGDGALNSLSQTVYPVDSGSPTPPCTTPPTGFVCINPPGVDIPVGGTPTGTTSNDPKRRVMKAAVVQCQALGVQGRFSINVSDVQVIEMFMTEPITGGGSSAAIVGEIIRTLTPYNSGGDIRSNVQLVN